MTLESIEAAEPPPASDPHPSSTPPPKFFREHWIRPSGGGEGSSCVLHDGRVFEKAGVNISIINSKLPPAAQKSMKSDHSGIPLTDQSVPYFVAGISIVLHPRNPHCPTVHLNYRYFELEDPVKAGENHRVVVWWRLRLDSLVSRQRRREILAQYPQISLRRTSPSILEEIQEMV